MRDTINIDDLRLLARRRLPKPIWDYLEGGADDEISLARNRNSFREFKFVPRPLDGGGNADPITSIMGVNSALPLFASPTGFSRLFHSHGERAVAAACGQAGIPYALSSFSNTSIEDIQGLAAGPWFFQLYILRDRGLVADMLSRARAAGAAALIITVDVATPGNRERDLRSGMTIPPRLTARSVMDFAFSPSWVLDYLLAEPLVFANFGSTTAGFAGADIENIGLQIEPAAGWRDIERIAALWNGPFSIKGLLHPSDVIQARNCGATSVILSNHGGRQLDGAASAMDVLPRVRDAVGGDLELIVDGGLRRGGDIVRALALGANACGAGRSLLYGLAGKGQAGVSRAIDIFKKEMERTMALLGCKSIADIARDHLWMEPDSGPSADEHRAIDRARFDPPAVLIKK
jgi:L-lactate dehydrogenase (cytochrome)